VNVLYWFDKNDTPAQRRMLRVHPRGDQKNPLTGVFACRAPVRPNLIALRVCKIVSVTGNVVTVEGLDAFDATPILDLKPFIPSETKDLRTPAWTKQ
jgi:tRNA-Thr(GGU) m(6)t(6)A37 methyltransferase TsaA